MKKFLVIFLLSYLWFSISNAGLEEPGKNNASDDDDPYTVSDPDTIIKYLKTKAG